MNLLNKYTDEIKYIDEDSTYEIINGISFEEAQEISGFILEQDSDINCIRAVYITLGMKNNEKN